MGFSPYKLCVPIVVSCSWENFVSAPLLLCPFTVASDIFMLKKDIAKTHCTNIGPNVLNNAPLSFY